MPLTNGYSTGWPMLRANARNWAGVRSWPRKKITRWSSNARRISAHAVRGQRPGQIDSVDLRAQRAGDSPDLEHAPPIWPPLSTGRRATLATLTGARRLRNGRRAADQPGRAAMRQAATGAAAPRTCAPHRRVFVDGAASILRREKDAGAGTRTGRLHCAALSEGCGDRGVHQAAASRAPHASCEGQLAALHSDSTHRHGHACRGNVPRDRCPRTSAPASARRRSSAPSSTISSTCRASSRRWRPSATTTWRSPTWCATACCSAGSAPPRPTPSSARAPSPTCRPSS